MNFIFTLFTGNLTIENDKVNKNLKKLIKKHVLKEAEAELAVADAKLGKLLKVCYPFKNKNEKFLYSIVGPNREFLD